MVKELWVEKHRPNKVEDYVFRDQRLEDQVRTWIKEVNIPHLLISGPAGTGKSSLANVLLRELNIDPGDILYINASDQTGVDSVRQQIQNFVCTVGIGEFKIVLLEECDYMTPNAMAALRRVMEDYADASRFILTCNYVHKVIPAIRSRSQEIELKTLDTDAFKTRVLEILLSEGVDLDLENDGEANLDTYIAATWPDLRKCINTIQLNVQNDKLLPPSDQASSSDWHIHAIELFKKNKITEARKMITSQIRTEEYEEFFKMCYRNLEWWGKTDEAQDEAILIIRDGMVKHAVSADPEINLSAMLIQLAKVGR